MDNSENHRFNESESNSNSMYTSESERNNNERHSESLTQSQQQHQHTSDEHNSKIRQDERSRRTFNVNAHLSTRVYSQALSHLLSFVSKT